MELITKTFQQNFKSYLVELKNTHTISWVLQKYFQHLEYYNGQVVSKLD